MEWYQCPRLIRLGSPVHMEYRCGLNDCDPCKKDYCEKIYYKEFWNPGNKLLEDK